MPLPSPRGAGPRLANDRFAAPWGMDLVPGDGQGRPRLLLNARFDGAACGKRRGSVLYQNLYAAGYRECMGLFPYTTPLGIVYVVGFWLNSTGDAVAWRVLDGTDQRDFGSFPLASAAQMKPMMGAPLGQDLVVGEIPGIGLVRIHADREDGDVFVEQLAAIDRRAVQTRSAFDESGVYLSAPPPGRIMHTFQDRLFVGTGNTVWWSNKQDVQGWNANSYITFWTPQNDPVTGIGSIGDALAVFTTRNIFVVRGDLQSLAGTVVRRPTAGVGCVAPRSVQEVAGRLYFLANDGVFAFDGSSAVLVSKSINPLLVPGREYSDYGFDLTEYVMDGTRQSEAHAITYLPDRVYCLTAASGTSNDGAIQYVHDYDTGQWSVWDGQRMHAGCVKIDALKQQAWLTADHSGKVFKQDSGWGDTVTSGTDASQVARAPIQFALGIGPEVHGQHDTRDLRYIRATMGRMSSALLSVRAYPVALTAPSATPAPTMSAITEATELLADASSSGFRLNTDTVQSAGAVTPHTDGPGLEPGPEWKIEIIDDLRELPVQVDAIGLDYTPWRRG